MDIRLSPGARRRLLPGRRLARSRRGLPRGDPAQPRAGRGAVAPGPVLPAVSRARSRPTPSSSSCSASTPPAARPGSSGTRSRNRISPAAWAPSRLARPELVELQITQEAARRPRRGSLSRSLAGWATDQDSRLERAIEPQSQSSRSRKQQIMLLAAVLLAASSWMVVVSWRNPRTASVHRQDRSLALREHPARR